MKHQSVTTVPSAPVSFEVLYEKMLPHFWYFARQYDRCRRTDQEDVIQELTGLALINYMSLIERGKEVFYTPIMKYAVQHYKEGRRFVGSNTTDILSEQTQMMGRSDTYQFSQFDDERRGDTMPFMKMRQASVFDQVQFKIDFEDWLALQTPRDCSIALDLSYGYTTSEVAKKHGVSDGLISQYRRRFEKSWDDFIADKHEPA